MFLSMFSPVHHRSVCVCKCVFVCVFMCINARMPDCPASDQSRTGIEKLMMPGMVRYQTKPRQSGMFLVCYRTKIIDAGLPIPALVFRITVEAA